MPNDKLSAKEAALIAAARAALEKKPPSAVSAATVKSVLPAARQVTPVTTPASGLLPAVMAAPAPSSDPAERVAALMAAARADIERKRRRQRKLYVWLPFAFIAVTGLSTLLWMWHKL